MRINELMHNEVIYVSKTVLDTQQILSEYYF